MSRIQVLKNPILNYTWGSHTAISGLLGNPIPSIEPEAELWMGAHPKASSMININGSWISLNEAISRNPEAILGTKVSIHFHHNLPFLFKVLAAEKPLSIQAHPDKIQAVKGFERENREKIPLDSPIRNYRDPNHKPELLCALSPFWALCGFRKIDETISLIEKAGIRDLNEEVGQLSRRPDSHGMNGFISHLMALDA
ncbi:MAG: mannose-6-phosphate isomerase, class I, partial [Thermodesulfobacteriota bacterium]